MVFWRDERASQTGFFHFQGKKCDFWTNSVYFYHLQTRQSWKSGKRNEIVSTYCGHHHNNNHHHNSPPADACWDAAEIFFNRFSALIITIILYLSQAQNCCRGHWESRGGVWKSMGSVFSGVSQLFTGGAVVPNIDIDVDKLAAGGKDLRRRNSMTFHITKFINHESDDYTDLLDMVKTEFETRLLSITTNSRDLSE